ncbi:hypothetical protein SERLA73DRAFT_189347 [Serpula lacrymans var. lacrymans S7.3]|uniref:DUF6533 domain-containing protein n=2 Tax=Serpula lacrymans var. lacrymans TaxID=341189 RepID=F8QDE1_SERL3|nr:uncharacterized protein SERLADRAFT_480112 [Serpula lacrymans var. lacrymans S7.9]EGN93612.1 hypothetical protein SERLA73DRAFT_189347 [Serpula lacrymans var. lacrymans S7.3]EGO18983.1 hypothetical protein SERLADRAFT_480112 [Serpula lacrymans var. lacrymans S7.9]
MRFQCYSSSISLVAGLAVWLYDYCITSGTEVVLNEHHKVKPFLRRRQQIHWVWGRQWKTTRIMFTLARYLPFIGAVMTVYSAVVTRTGNCEPFDTAENIIHIVGIVAAEGLLVQRTYTFWEGSKQLLAGLLGLAAILIAMAIFVPTQVQAPEGYTNPGSCLFFDGRTGAIVYGFLLLFEFILLFLIIYKRFKNYRFTNSSVIITLYLDGIMYISCIILITLANILLTVSVPVGYINSLDTLQIVVHSVLASRILFNLRRTDALGPAMRCETLMPLVDSDGRATSVLQS